MVYNLPDLWPMPANGELNDSVIYGPMLGEKLSLAKSSHLATGEISAMTTNIEDRIIAFSIDRKIAINGAPLIVTTVQDITQVRKRESTLRTLLLEVSHRSKNLLAIVQGLASQSAKYTLSFDGFLKLFNGRLQAMSTAQDILVETNWQGASLFELARRQLALADIDRDTEVYFQGLDLQLDANQSLHIGLALHELVMMVIASGAPRGTRRISLTSTVDPAMASVTLNWESTPGVNALYEPEGFGTVLLERVVPSAVSGKSSVTRDQSVINWSIRFPLQARQLAEE